MDIKISFHNMDHSDPLEQHTREKLEKLQENQARFMLIYPKVVQAVNGYKIALAKYTKRNDKINYDKKLKDHLAKGKPKNAFKLVYDENSEAYTPVVYDEKLLTKEEISKVNRQITYFFQKLIDDEYKNSPEFYFHNKSEFRLLYA